MGRRIVPVSITGASTVIVWGVSGVPLRIHRHTGSERAAPVWTPDGHRPRTGKPPDCIEQDALCKYGPGSLRRIPLLVIPVQHEVTVDRQ